MKFIDRKYDNNGMVIFFPGQGMPYLGMGSKVYKDPPSVKCVWDCASEISGFNVQELCIKGPMNKLVRTYYQQVAVTAINIATLYLFRQYFSFNEIGYSGHSAGEYSALFSADVIDLESLFKMIHYRASIMEELANNKKGVMYIVKNCPYQMLYELIEQQNVWGAVNICCDNNEFNQVIGGDIESMRKVVGELLKMKVETRKLAVNGAWHTELMSEGRTLLSQFLQQITFSVPTKPLVMNVSAEFVTDIDIIKKNLVEQLTKTVKWMTTMELWCQQGYKNFIELGDKKILYLFAKDSLVLKGKNIWHINDYI